MKFLPVSVALLAICAVAVQNVEAKPRRTFYSSDLIEGHPEDQVQSRSFLDFFKKKEKKRPVVVVVDPEDKPKRHRRPVYHYDDDSFEVLSNHRREKPVHVVQPPVYIERPSRRPSYDSREWEDDYHYKPSRKINKRRPRPNHHHHEEEEDEDEKTHHHHYVYTRPNNGGWGSYSNSGWGHSNEFGGNHWDDHRFD